MDGFLKPCEQPFRQDVEPAVRWRLLPPLVCHALGLKGNRPLAFCWLGLAVFAAVLAARLDRLSGSRPWAAIGTVGFATSGPYQRGSPLCRTASKSVTSAAIATLSESACPAIGMRTGKSAFSSQNSLSPYCSLPMMTASGPRRSESE
jgi:hypothetical protein